METPFNFNNFTIFRSYLTSLCEKNKLEQKNFEILDKILIKYKIGDGVIDKYHFRINKAEGLVVIPNKNIFFIVSDDDKKLYRIALP